MGNLPPSGHGGPRPVWPGLIGGRYQPLTRPEMERIHRTVLDVLEQTGIADPTPSMIELVTAAGDRGTPAAWETAGRQDVRDRARERVRAVLRSHDPDHIGPGLDDRIRAGFDIQLPREAMRPGDGRWP